MEIHRSLGSAPLYFAIPKHQDTQVICNPSPDNNHRRLSAQRSPDPCPSCLLVLFGCTVLPITEPQTLFCLVPSATSRRSIGFQLFTGQSPARGGPSTITT
ncbi:hypothetical protein RSOLAG1IB_03497 [Rhizoctonia solani AG-1 IB]|uniref:Uncharacterized protein n=1 Tax=Thanatephorus cucumeris (strain AG1-IB / isolate 7/3/14) TaxID=1108050 RepID=A0A0B7FRT3_THACB|nr:hypothetical protein RSOLAG1IB_03497 [Rhizoctonia solani AG-1 IB]